MWKTAKRFVLAAGFALLLPGMAGAAGFGQAERSLWEDWASPLALLARAWDGLEGLADAWTAGASIDPNGEGPAGAGVCVGDCGPSIDPNG